MLTLGTPVQFTVTVVADTGVKTVSFKGLPNGLKYDKKNGVIIGTPTKSGTFTPVISVTTKGKAKGSIALGSVKVPELSNIVVGTFYGGLTLNGKEGVIVMKIAKNGKTTGKVTFGDRKTLSIKSGYFLDAEKDAANYVLNFKDGSQMRFVFSAGTLGEFTYGSFVADTDWGQDAAYTAYIAQDVFSRKDAKPVLAKFVKKHVYKKGDLTFTSSPKGVVKVKGTYNGMKISCTSYFLPEYKDNGYYIFTCDVPYPNNSGYLRVDFAVDSKGNWIDDI